MAAPPNIETTFEKAPCGHCAATVASFEQDAYDTIRDTATEKGHEPPIVLTSPDDGETFAVALRRDAGFVCPMCGFLNFVRPKGEPALN